MSVSADIQAIMKYSLIEVYILFCMHGTLTIACFCKGHYKTCSGFVSMLVMLSKVLHVASVLYMHSYRTEVKTETCLCGQGATFDAYTSFCVSTFEICLRQYICICIGIDIRTY
jgi:hypothetical protein